MKESKSYKKSQEGVEKGKVYSLDEALEMMEKFSKVKFDETVELAIKLNIDPSKSDQQMRGVVDFPHGTGKSKKIAVFTETQVKEAKKAGADLVGGEDLIEKIGQGKIDFDVAVATPEMMSKLAKVAKVLGPKGLMPNPKTQTVGPKVAPLVQGLKKGRASYKTDDSGNIHQMVGKRSFGKKQLKENIEIFLDYLGKNKPKTVKGKLIKSITLSATMSPGIKIKY